MLGDAVIILANMRGGYVNVGNTVHTLFRMSGRPRKISHDHAHHQAVEEIKSTDLKPE